MALVEQKRERLLEDVEEDIEQVDDETFYNGLQPIVMTDLNSFSNLPSNKRGSEAESTCTTVTIRSGGRVCDNRPKKIIPTWHKYVFVILLVCFFFAIPWLMYGFSEEAGGLFRQEAGDGGVNEDILEHEKKVDWGTRDIVAFCCASVLIMIAAGGGIGGGGVLVPTYIFVLGFEPKYAIPLSNCTILGSSLSNLILNVNKRHPKADRPLIDWDIMLMMEPLTVAGAVCGTFINVISPPWLITIMLVLLLTATAYKTLNKGVKRYKEESATIAAIEEAEKDTTSTTVKSPEDGAAGDYKALDDAPSSTLPISDNTYENNANAQTVLAWTTEDVKQWWERSLPKGCKEYIHIVDECELDGADLLDLDYRCLSEYNVKRMLIMKILRRIKQLKQSLGIPEETISGGSALEAKNLEEDEPDPRMVKAQKEDNHACVEILKSEQNHPAWKVFVMFLVTGGVLLCTILKGGGDINPLNLNCHDTLYWVLTLIAVPYVLLFCFIGRNHLLGVYYAKQECNYEYLPRDVEWNERNTINYPLLCSVAGLAAGMFGIGGGIVKGPLMLEMDVEPKVTSATSATMILFTSSGASVSYLIFQQLNLNYAMVVFCLGIVFTLIGQLSLNAIVKKYNRSSLIILVIGATVFLSAIFMGIESSSHLIELAKGNAEPGGSICGAD